MPIWISTRMLTIVPLHFHQDHPVRFGRFVHLQSFFFFSFPFDLSLVKKLIHCHISANLILQPIGSSKLGKRTVNGTLKDRFFYFGAGRSHLQEQCVNVI